MIPAKTRSPKRTALLLAFAALLAACQSAPPATEPPPDGWANNAPTIVEEVIDRDTHQLLRVRQGRFATWVKVPHVGARVGDYVLLGQGTARSDVQVPELDRRVAQIVDIAHARAVDRETAERVVGARVPEDAIGVGQLYAELGERADTEVVVHGVVTKVAGAIGWYWVHLRDASGDPAFEGLDLTIQTHDNVTEGQRAAYRGTLRKDVDLGFGYFYEALVRDGAYVR